MNGQPTAIVTPHFAFAGMQADPHFYPESPHGFTDRGGTVDRTRWAVERDEKPVPGLLDLSATKPTELFPDGPVVGT